VVVAFARSGGEHQAWVSSWVSLEPVVELGDGAVLVLTKHRSCISCYPLRDDLPPCLLDIFCTPIAYKLDPIDGKRLETDLLAYACRNACMF
jgi:hypothetical protein